VSNFLTEHQPRYCRSVPFAVVQVTTVDLEAWYIQRLVQTPVSVHG